MEDRLRKLTVISSLFAFFLMVAAAQAQQVDAAFGVSALTAPSSSSGLNSSNYSGQTIGGGTYPGFSFDVLLHKRLGIQTEINWRASQNLYQGYQPFRPIFWDVNGIWTPHLAPRIDGEILAGVGVQNVRFYNNYYTCSYFAGCTTYNSENKFDGHFGVGLRLYVTHNLFVRPEAHLYLINNNSDFSSWHAQRYGASIGYSFGR
jgi:hypothetical protein